jgi:hypothetical protein
MGSKFRKLVEDRIAKTGEGWEMAVRYVRAQANGAGPALEQQASQQVPAAPLGPPLEPWVTDLLNYLHLSTFFRMLVGRVPASSGGANLALVIAQADDLARNPRYFAESGGATMTITRDQLTALVKLGAADEGELQMFRSGRWELDEGMTFSDQCESCGGWVWCGDAEREGACVCGQRYRVAFDGMLANIFSMRQGRCCFDCGAEWRLDPKGSGLDPGRELNEYQWQCEKCLRAAPKTPEEVEALHPFKRRRYRAMLAGPSNPA